MLGMDTGPNSGGPQSPRQRLLSSIDRAHERAQERIEEANQSIPEDLNPFAAGDHGPIGRSLAMPNITSHRRGLVYEARLGLNEACLAALGQFCEDSSAPARATLMDALSRHAQGHNSTAEIYDQLDLLTPFFAPKLEKMAPQKQLVLIALACNRLFLETLDLTAVQIVEATRLQSYAVRTHLTRLNEEGLVKLIDDTHPRQYQISDIALHAYLILRFSTRTDFKERRIKLIAQRVVPLQLETNI
jgi:hypothetical protein